MSNYTTNLPSPAPDSTAAYFNNFFGPTFNVPQNLNEAVIGFFQQVAANKESAALLAGALIYTSMAQNLDPMAVLQEFKNLPKGQLNTYLTVFLNLNRIGTSLLGISNAPITNKYITRTILS